MWDGFTFLVFVALVPCSFLDESSNFGGVLTCIFNAWIFECPDVYSSHIGIWMQRSNLGFLIDYLKISKCQLILQLHELNLECGLILCRQILLINCHILACVGPRIEFNHQVRCFFQLRFDPIPPSPFLFFRLIPYDQLPQLQGRLEVLKFSVWLR